MLTEGGKEDAKNYIMFTTRKLLNLVMLHFLGIESRKYINVIKAFG